MISRDAEELPCLHCGADATRPCVTPDGRLSPNTHHVRVEALRYALDPPALVAQRQADAQADVAWLRRKRKEAA